MENVEVAVVNPLENAVTEISKKVRLSCGLDIPKAQSLTPYHRPQNAELKEKFAAMESIADGEADNSYTMALNGVVDAAVNGGIGNYATFINGQYKVDNSEIWDDVNSSDAKRSYPSKLLDVLGEQIEILEMGVRLHETKCSPSLLPLHQHIESMFNGEGGMKEKTTRMIEEGKAKAKL